ncbi:Rha family transcriptional regulator [Domibacillus tundrae]|uniref:Rha family transcriptional regulator n=1 Tax=Domibacillus tundrae TaxID=1587527 RepID=UPI000618231F|nr:Rha family transcriptional regulator [Domibacillus tundrae]
MNQLVFIQNGSVLTDSLTVAAVFEKQHKDVMRDIRNLECSEEFNRRNFALVDYTDVRNRVYNKYLIKRDGLAFLVMGYTGKTASEYKEKFILKFNEMEEQLRNKVHVLDERTSLIQSMKLTIETAERQDQIQEVVNTHSVKISELETKVEEQITLTSGEQRRLQKAVAIKIYALESDPAVRPRLFKELHREIKDRFGVSSYKDVKQKELQSAIRYVENWVPRKAVI